MINHSKNPTTAAMPIIVFLIGLCLSFLAANQIRNQTLHEAEGEFQRRVERVLGEVVRRFQTPVYGLNGARGMYAASEQVTRSGFRAYVLSRFLTKEFPGVRGFGYIERVQRSGLDSFLAAERNDDAPDFALRQLVETDHPDFLIIKFIEPGVGNSGALGLDIGSEGNRRKAAEQAIESGEPAMSGPITLVQDNRKTPGVLIFVPVYRNGTSPANAEERRASLRGLVYAPIVIAELLSDIKDVGPDSIDFELIDKSPSAEGSATLYDFDGHTTKLSDTQHVAEGRRFSANLPLSVLGRDLTLQLSSTPGFEKAISFRQAWLVLMGLSTISLLIALLLYQQINEKRAAELLAKKITTKLEMEEARSRDFSRSASDWFWETDDAHRFTYFSDNFEQVYGIPPERLLGKNRKEVIELMSPQEGGAVPADLENHLAQLDAKLPFKNFEYQIILDNGSVRWISVSGVPYFVDNIFAGYRGTGTVITDRKNAEAEIRAQENQIRAIIETTVDGIIVIDAEGLVQSINPAAINMFGYAKEEIIGRNVSMLMPAPYATKHDGYLQAYLATGNKKIIGIGREVSGKRKDGTTFPMELAVSEIEAYGIRRFTGIVRDISERKTAENDLLAAKQVADDANRAKSSFLATMSHEIRTPMNGILGMLQLLLRTELTRQQLDYATKAEGATKALLGIINDILDFSKVEAGKLELNIEPMSLDEIARDLSAVLSSNLDSKDVEILFDIANEVPPVILGDPLRLRQVLLNLAGNAIKFTEQGEVVIRIRVIQHCSDAADLEFSVSDTGIGIPADKIDGIFESFSQAESSTTRRFGGTGLGLSICHRLVGMMGGTLAVKSELGKGSRFFFTVRFNVPARLPADTDGANGTCVQMGVQRSYLTPPGTSLRVLAIEDNAHARQLLQAMAESMGWQIQCVTSGEEALEHVQQPKVPHYDLVLMDWGLPGIDGWQATLKLRQLKSTEKLPIILMAPAAGLYSLSGHSPGESVLVDGYLTKPITGSMLYEAAAEAIVKRAGGLVTRPAVQVSNNLQGLRLLVVDDNRLNQQIAKELLESCGAQVSIASGGHEGVAQALAATPPFDVILMDVQMPDIDGLEATRRVRADSRMSSVPIIAMTANALKSDQEACHAAGMVDHVAKPIDLDILTATILRHVSTLPAGTASPKPISGAISSPELILTDVTNAVDVEAAIKRVGGNLELYDALVEIYRSDAAEALAQLQQHIRHAEFPQARLRAHTLKGLSATVGATAVAELAGEMETMLGQMSGEIGKSDTSVLTETAITLSKQFSNALDALLKRQGLARRTAC